MASFSKPRSPKVAMVSPAGDGHGGISAVVKSFIDYGICEELDIVIIDTFDNRKLLKLPKLFVALTRFFLLLATRPIEVVHINTSIRNSFYRKLLFWFIAKTFRKKIFWQIHHGAFVEFARERPWILNILQSSSGVAVFSSAIGEALRDLSPQRPIDFRLVANPYLPPKLPNFDKQELPLTRALFLGRLTEKKGLSDLLLAWHKIISHCPDLKLTIAGDGDRLRYEKMTTDLNMRANVEFVGWVEGEKKHKLLQENQLLLLPSYQEAMPVCILEAMGWGCVAVASAVGAIPEILEHGTCGVLHEPGDPIAIHDAILQLTNPDKRMTLAQRARERVDTGYSPQTITEQLSRWYNGSPTDYQRA